MMYGNCPAVVVAKCGKEEESQRRAKRRNLLGGAIVCVARTRNWLPASVDGFVG